MGFQMRRRAFVNQFFSCFLSIPVWAMRDCWSSGLRGASQSRDSVRTASKTKKKPPTSIIPRDDARRWREGASTQRDAEICVGYGWWKCWGEVSHAFKISTACVGSSRRLRPFGEAGGGLRVRFRGSRVAGTGLFGFAAGAAGAAAASAIVCCRIRVVKPALAAALGAAALFWTVL